MKVLLEANSPQTRIMLAISSAKSGLQMTKKEGECNLWSNTERLVTGGKLGKLVWVHNVVKSTAAYSHIHDDTK